MNKDKMKKCVNYRIRLRPVPRRIWEGREQPEEDWIWHVESVDNQGMVTLRNISTGHVARLGSDHIRNYDTDHPSEIDAFKHGFFTLKGEARFVDGEFIIEPNHSSKPHGGL